MNTRHATPWLLCGFLTLLLSSLGLEVASPAPALSQDKVAESKKIPIGKKNVHLEILPDKSKRVLVNASVCRRMDLLEHLMCRKLTKEHEAILAADVDARDIHTALLLAGAERGHPVKFRPKFEPPTGTKIKILLQYAYKGKTITVPAQQWIKNIKTKKPMEQEHWVFAGSLFIDDPVDKTRPPLYAANDGDLISVVNFDTSMLDLPIDSSKENEGLLFEANTDVIPPLDTPVLVILEPIPEKKKK
jgi:hypothetical protein